MESTKAANSSHGGYCLTRPKSRTAWEELTSIIDSSKNLFRHPRSLAMPQPSLFTHMAVRFCVPSEYSDQPGHLPSLIRVFAVRMKKPWFLSYPLSAQWRLWSDWASSEDSDQTGRMPRLIWVFAGCTSFCWFCHVIAHTCSLNPFIYLMLQWLCVFFCLQS